MAKTCDNTSAGVIIINDDLDLLLIERKSWPYGFACPAGHLDGDTPEGGAVREISEEVGITIYTQNLILDKEFPNPCKREGGSHHHWYVYEALDYDGTPTIREEEKEKVRRIIWADRHQLNELMKRTEDFARKYKLEVTNLSALTKALCEDKEWQENPGIELVWYVILNDMINSF